MSESKNKPNIRLATKKKVMDLIARRDHSEKELKKKLKEKFAHEEESAEAIQEALDFAKDNNWIGDPTDLAYRMADMLHRRNKGINYINNYLREKGLPSVDPDKEMELQKALAIVENKYKNKDQDFSREEKAKIGRFLTSRGFDSETVRKVIYEKL